MKFRKAIAQMRNIQYRMYVQFEVSVSSLMKPYNYAISKL